MNTFPGGQSQGGQPAVQAYAPVPQVVPQAGVPAQPAYQGVPTGYPNAGSSRRVGQE